MASIERTAYPRFPRTVTLKDLQASFTPDGGEIDWAKSKARGTNLRIALATLLKCFQYLHYFPSPKAIPPEIVEHVSASLGLPSTSSLDYGGPLADTMYRHHNAIRNLLGVHRYDDKTGRKLLMRVAHEAASVVNTRTDLEPRCIHVTPKHRSRMQTWTRKVTRAGAIMVHEGSDARIEMEFVPPE